VRVLSRSYEWRGRRVAWDQLGVGPPVIFCHGTPWSSQLWAPYAEALAQHFTVYLWDMPGYGQSSKDAAHAVDLGVQGELLADLLHVWGLRAPHVVAHDFGGAVALRALLLQQARYASLCLVDVVALRPWGSDFFRLVHDHADVFVALPPHVHLGAIEAYIRSASVRGLTADDLAMLTEPWSSVEGQAAFYRQIAQADERFTDDVQPRYGEIDLPVQVIWGAEDSWIPLEKGRELCRLIPGAVLEIVDEAGHLIQLDAPDELMGSLRRWLLTHQSVGG